MLHYTHVFRSSAQKFELEVRGRARREAVRRRKSEWKVNLDNRNFSRSNGSRKLLTRVVDKLNFRPNFKFSRLKFGGLPPHLGCALASLGESLVHVKI